MDCGVDMPALVRALRRGGSCLAQLQAAKHLAALLTPHWTQMCSSERRLMGSRLILQLPAA